MEEKKLPLELPPVIGYLHHAYHLSVAQGHPDFNEWFNSSYIQLRYYPKTGWLNFITVNYEFYPLIDWQSFSSKIIKSNDIDIIKFVISAIENGYYVWLYIDEYYDPNRISYKIRHNMHECMLYGYNTGKGSLYSIGFNTQFSYTYSEISFSDFLSAFDSADGGSPVRMLKPNETDLYKFDLINVKNILEDYINSRNTSERIRMFRNPTSDAIYGVQIYKYLKANIENPKYREYLYDIRPLHILWEHKKCMISRIKFLYDHKYLDNLDPLYGAYGDIEKKALMIRNLQLKYANSKKEDYIKKITSYLDEIHDEEIDVLTQLLKCL